MRNKKLGKIKKKERKEGVLRSLLLEAQMETSPYGILVVDSSGKIILNNRKFQRMWNVPQKIMEKKEVKIIMQWIMRKVKEPQEFVQKIKYVNAHPMEKRRDEIELKDSRIFSRYTFPLVSPKKICCGRILYFTDITERRKKEKEMALYLKGFEDSPNPMFLVKYENQQPKISKINKAFTDYYLFTEKEMLGKNPRILSSGKMSKEYYKDMWASILDPKRGRWRGEIINKAKDGKLLYGIINTNTIFDENNKPQYFISSYTDITPLKRALELIKKNAADASAVAKMRADFMNMVSHELKTPITAMSANLELLEEIKQNGDDREGEKKYVQALRRNMTVLKTLIDNILEISRIEAKEFSLNIRDVDVASCIEEAIEDLKIFADRKGIEIITKIETLPGIKADKERIKEIVLNLLSNAIKFTDKGAVTIEAKKKDSFISIAVKDTGIGIPKDKLPLLFEKFYQVDQMHGKKYGGTGLGLTIARQLVLLHGGTIKVHSEVGKGSTFTLTLPVEGGERKSEREGKREQGEKLR